MLLSKAIESIYGIAKGSSGANMLPSEGGQACCRGVRDGTKSTAECGKGMSKTDCIKELWEY